jgi:hypothetical protein
MPSPDEILKDPSYQSANPETKQAIFEKHVASSEAFKTANPETQSAIKQRFGLGDGGNKLPEEPGLVGVQEAIGLPADSPAPPEGAIAKAKTMVKDWFTGKEAKPFNMDEAVGKLTGETAGGAALGVVAPKLLEKGGKALQKVPVGPVRAVGRGMEAAGDTLSLLPAGERALRGAGGGAAQAVAEVGSDAAGIPAVVGVPLSMAAGGIGEAGTSFIAKEGGSLLKAATKAASGDANAAVGALKGIVNPYKEMNAASAAKLQSRLFGDKIPGYINKLIGSENRMAVQEALRKADPTLVTGFARKAEPAVAEPIPGTRFELSPNRDLATLNGKLDKIGQPKLEAPGPRPKDMASVMTKRQQESQAAAEKAAKEALRPASEIYRERMFAGVTQAINSGKTFSSSDAGQTFAKKIDTLIKSRELSPAQGQKLLAQLRTDRNPEAVVRGRYAENVDNLIRTYGKPAEKGGQEGAAAIPAKLASEIRGDLRKALNSYAEEVGLGKIEAQYRGAYSQEMLAEAKDKLPHFLYGFGDKAEFDKFARNLAQEPEGKDFLQKSVMQHLANVDVAKLPKEFTRLQKTMVNAELLTPADMEGIRKSAESIARVADKGVQLRAAQRLRTMIMTTAARHVFGTAGEAAQRQQGQE